MPKQPVSAAAGGLPKTSKIAALKAASNEAIRRSPKLPHASNDVSPKADPSESCLVARLAHEAAVLIKTYEALDQIPDRKSKQQAILQRLDGIENLASLLPAKSLAGALFHCYLIRRYSDDDAVANREEAITRLVLSLRNFIEGDMDLGTDDTALEDYYAGTRDLQFHSLISSAIRGVA